MKIKISTTWKVQDVIVPLWENTLGRVGIHFPWIKWWTFQAKICIIEPLTNEQLTSLRELMHKLKVRMEKD